MEPQTLGAHSDDNYLKLSKRYGLKGADLVGELRTVETTQENKPLQVFPNPRPGANYIISITTEEGTSLCPKTGQPDFWSLLVEYVPGDWVMEMKSFKLYIWSYRQECHFFEELTNLIFEDLVKVLEPIKLEVLCKFNARGGMKEVVSRSTINREEQYKRNSITE